MGGVGGAESARVPDECNRVLGQELLPAEEAQHADLVEAATLKEVDAWRRFDVFEPRRQGTAWKQIAQTRWVLTWKMVNGKKCGKAKLVAKGYQGPELQDGTVGTSGRVSLRYSHLQVISLRAIEKRNLWSSDIKNALFPADGSSRGAFLSAPVDWGPLRSDRVGKLKALAHGLGGAPAAIRRSLEKLILNSDASRKRVGLRCRASTFDPFLSFTLREGGSTAGAFATHTDDILGRGVPDALSEIRDLSE